MKQNNLILTMGLLMLLVISCSDPTEKNETPTLTTKETIKTTPEVSAIPTLDELQSDPDIIWMGEVMVDYALNYDRWSFDVTADNRALMEKIGFKERNSFKILKYQATNLNESTNEDHILTNKVLANRTKMTFYRNASISNTYLADEIAKKVSHVDTFITFDPETKEEKKMVVVDELNPEDIKAYRVKQLIYYSKKDICFKTKALAVAPLLLKRDNQGKVTSELEVLFWMKPNVLMTTPDLNAPAITWAKRTYRNFDLSKVKVLKQEYAINAIMDSMFMDIRKNAGSIKLGSTFTRDGTYFLEKEEAEHLGGQIDTVVIFDKKSMQEVVQIEETVIEGRTIEGLRLLQDWVWNEEAQSLSIRYVGFAPIVSRYDEENKFLNSGPMFIRKVEDI